MYSHFNNKSTTRLLWVALATMMAIGSVKAQDDFFNNRFSLTVNPVMPPYTAKLSDYFTTPGKIGGSIMVNSQIDARSYRFYLHVAIINVETEASVRTRRGFVPSNPREVDLLVIPNTTLIQYGDLQQAMSEQNLEYSGFTREQVASEGLPPGQYVIKLTLFVFPNGWNGFMELGSKYSPPFTISPAMAGAAEPPIIINPANNSRLNPEQKQSLQFNWTMPGGAAAGTHYKLRIIEVSDPGMNYRDMLHNDRYPAFFETTVSAAPMYLYTAANPPFKEDKTYAFVVRAFNAIGTATVNYKNDGYSEINTFSFKDATPVIAQKPPEDSPQVVAEENLAIFVPYCSNCQPDLEGAGQPSGSTYRLLGNTLNPNLITSGPNAQGASNQTPVSIDIPANAVAVSNAKNFYLRWEDKSSLLNADNARSGEGIVYQLQVRDAISKKLVWEKMVWNNTSYEQTKNGLPFVDGQEYILQIAAMKGTVTMNGFDIAKDVTGKPIALASSNECTFTFMLLPDLPDLEEYTVKGKLSYKFEHHPEKYPITTRTATLTRYTSISDAATKKVIHDMNLTPRDERHSIPITINDDGTFETTFYAYSNNGLISAEEEIIGVAGTMEIREFFNIELNSPYYRPLEKRGEKPTKTIVNLTDKVIDVGEITFNVWSYTLEIEVTKGYSKWVSGELTGSYRENNPQHVTGKASRLMFGMEGFEDMPYYEGDIPASTPISKWGKSEIAAGKVESKKDANGVTRTYVTFDKLICNYQSNDFYFIDVNQTLEVDGKKEEYVTNEFNHDKFQYRPENKEVSEALNSYKSNFLVKRKATLIDRTPPKSTVKGKLVFADPCVNKNETQPLANTDIALVVTYLLIDKKGNTTVMDKDHLYNEDKTNDAFAITGAGENVGKAVDAGLDKLEDRNTILATTRTDANGNFEFKNFAHIDSLTTTSYNGYTNVGGGGEFSGNFHVDGKLKRTVRVVVNNSKKHFWLNPDNDIDVQPNAEVDVKTLKAYLDTYKLRVKPVGNPYYELTDENKKGKVLKGAFVKIKRDPIYPGEPENAFSPEEKKVGENGCLFVVPRHLLRTNNPVRSVISTDDMMNWLHIHVFTKDTVGEHAFRPEKTLFPRDHFKKDEEIRRTHTALKNATEYFSQPCVPTYKGNTEGYRFASDFKDITCDIYFRLYPEWPIISGRVLDAENTKRSVESGEVHLKVIGTAYYEQDYGMGSYARIYGYDRMQPISEAKEKGYFSFKHLIPNVGPIVKDGRTQNKGQSDYKLFVKARGYTLSLFQQEGEGKVENIQSNIWFPAEPLKPKIGQQIHFPQILMRPNGWVTGCVMDEHENGQEAIVRTTRSKEVETISPPLGSECGVMKIQHSFDKKTATLSHVGNNWFKVHAPSGYTDTLFVIPRDLNFFPDTILLPVMPEGEYNLGKVVVKERLHRVRIVVRPNVGEYLTSAPPGIPGVTVKLDIPGSKNEVTTDEKGVAEFIFKNAGHNFHFEVIPPDDSDYIAAAGELTNRDSKEMITYTVRLPKGATVTGEVTTEGKPVPNAQLWVMNGSNKRETKTDSDGKYTLRGIKPVEHAQKYNATIHCGAPNDDSEFNNLIGQKRELSFETIDGSGVADFDLEWFDKANIKSLHGFKVTVTDVKEDGGGAFRITGKLHLEEAPGKFEMKESIDQNPAFTDLKVKINDSEKDEKGRPYFEAADAAFSVDMKWMNAKLNAGENNYAVRLENDGEEFLKIAKDGVTGGFIRSKARIEASSFSFSSVNFTFDKDQFFFSDLEGNQSSGKVTSIKSYLDKAKMEDWRKSVESGKGDTYGIHDTNGNPLKFSFIEFDAVSPLASSRLLPNGVITLKPDVWFINPLLKSIRQDTIRIDLPDIKITPDKINEEGITLKNLSVKFENWTIDVNNCIIDAKKGGISSKDVTVRTGRLDIPAKSFILSKDLFVLNDFDVTKLPLGKGMAYIDIAPGTTVQFGVDPKCGMDLKPHLMLSLVNDGGSKPVGSIKNLPGFAHPLEFQAIKQISNGEDIISFAPNSRKMRLYDVVDFLPYTINSYDDEFNIDGAIDYGIPRVASNINYKLIYKKKGGKLNLELGTSDVSFTQVGTFRSLMSRQDIQKVTDGLVKLHGTIEEPGHLEPIRVVVTKQRESVNNYRIWMEREDPKKAQSIRLGGTTPGEPEFLVDKADMKIINNDWDLLRLKLIPSDTYGKNSGFGSNPLYFELRGELRTDLSVSDQSIDLVGTNIDPQTGGQKNQGLTGFVFKYDYASQELVGDMTLVDQNIAGVKFGGVLKMAVGRPGFYFSAAGTMQTSPFGKINAGFLLGYYDKRIPDHVWQGILQYSARKEIPCGFTGDSFRGFYALGAIAVPFVTFDYEFEVPGIASGGVKFDVSAEASVFGSFQPKNNELGFSAMVYAEAAAYLDAITCTSISAHAKATIKGETALKLNAPYTARLTVCGDIAFGGCIKQGIPNPFTFECEPLLEIGKSFEFHAGLTGEIDLKGSSMKPRITDASIGTGLCKMKSSCQMETVKDDPCD
ncbi:MAG TPA: TANFOR domain-containing protein [Petrimonas sp.]|nr:TANFOR domain-containing protein [Petrimonas sp.]